MSIEKLEPRLRAHIDDERRRASLRGTDPLAAEETPIEVTISHSEVIRAPEGVARQDRREALAELARRIRTIQRPVLQGLRRLTGREPVLIHSLVNAVTARLTPAQLETLAETDEVGLVRLEKLEEVTCMNESVHVLELTEAWEELAADGVGVAVALLD